MAQVVSFWDEIAGRTFENEATVETRLIMPLLLSLGYNEADNIAPKYPVVFQEGRLGRRPEADFVIFAERPHSRATSLITVEAKPPSENLTDGKAQGESYAANIRTPLLIITNGKRFELWQIQTSTESECVLQCNVSDLATNRGNLEQIASLSAAVYHCRQLQHKNFGLASRDLSAYETAEFARIDGQSFIIPRKLNSLGALGAETSSASILPSFPNGALLIGASGLGKTMLCQDLRRQAIERRWAGEDNRLPVEVFLPDVLKHMARFEDYLKDRVSAHCPQITTAAFQDLLRIEGVVLLCDGFDRVAIDQRATLEGVLANFRRDYPKSQIFIMTRPSARPERITLPALELQNLNDTEQNEFVAQYVALEMCDKKSPWGNASNFLCSISRYPLILVLVLEYFRDQNRLPRALDGIFKAWLDRLIPPSMPIAKRIDLKQLLTVIANETTLRPINEEEVVNLTRIHGFSDDLLQTLLDTDSLTRRDATFELRHEALGDYLRALHVTGSDFATASSRLDKLPLRAGSQLPALLMATAFTPEMQRLVWSRVAWVDLSAAITAIRYRADVSATLSAYDAQEATQRLLADILDGLELPLDAYFTRFSGDVRASLVGEVAQYIGISGVLSHQYEQLTYHFRKLQPSEESVIVGLGNDHCRIFGKSLRLMGLRLDSGRLIGLDHVRDAVIKIIEARAFDGGNVWTEEIVSSRLRHLIQSYGFPIDLKTPLPEIRTILMPYRKKFVEATSFRDGQNFSMSKLIKDIDHLTQSGRDRLTIWWADTKALDLDAEEGRDAFREIVNAHYLRSQLAFVEVVEHNFPGLASQFPSYQVLPVRYDLDVRVRQEDNYRTTHWDWKWLPVQSFDMAGAITSFGTARFNIDAMDSYVEEIDASLSKLGRSAPNCRYETGWMEGLDFTGHSPFSRGDIDETTVISSVVKMLIRDIEYVFKELPSGDEYDKDHLSS